ncbi:hypothetical protein [Nonomuraea sp. GTA35]|uniref:hypothetical protein n=1 Tax=Nonomuraea sp. GTA35 TaxID=1676746 RepID=UPI0035BF6BA2
MAVREEQVRKLLAAEIAFTYADNGKPLERASATLDAARRNSSKEEADAAVARYAAMVRRGELP